MPQYLKGVISIRGSVVPVVDLRTKFGLVEAEKTVDTSIIVMDLQTGSAAGAAVAATAKAPAAATAEV